jgi:Gas vesicle synthesis protein GvpL/GvpF
VIEICAITEEPLPRLPDSDDLQAVSSAGLVALCTPAQEQTLTPEVLWSREEMLEQWMEHCDLLPVRYGTRLEDEAAVARVLAERRGELVEALQRVRGSVELSVRVLEPESATSEPDEPTSGADYLRTRVRHAEVANDVHAALEPLARAGKQNAGRATGELLRAAYLVDRDGVGKFAERVGDLQKSNPQLRLLCTGPWPPYSFTSG